MSAAASHSSDAARALVGTTIDGLWHVDALVAVGGSATIYAATDGRGKPYAVKVFDVELADVPSALAHFRAEGRIANRIGHPGVVSVLAEGTTEDGAPYLVMPLLDGETAQQRLKRHPGGLPAREALAIVEAVLGVLVAAHERGIVHRDLKPDNVFLERGGGVRVLDFGIARLEDNPDRTMHGTVLGTPGYMPPEQARGKLDEVGPRSDVWSAGALLYTLLTGRVLHEAPTLIASVLRAQNEPVSPASQLLSGAGPALVHALDGALAFDLAQRWLDATAMLWAVRAAIEEAGAKQLVGSCPGVSVDSLTPSAREGGESSPVTMPGPGEIWRPVPWIAGFAAAAAALLIAAFVHGRAAGPVVAAASAPPAARSVWHPPPIETAAIAPEPAELPAPVVEVDSLPEAAAPAPAPVASAKHGAAAHRKAQEKAQEIVRSVDF